MSDTVEPTLAGFVEIRSVRDLVMQADQTLFCHRCLAEVQMWWEDVSLPDLLRTATGHLAECVGR